MCRWMSVVAEEFMNTKKFIRLSINYSAFCIFFFIFAPESRSRKQNCLAHKKNKPNQRKQRERKRLCYEYWLAPFSVISKRYKKSSLVMWVHKSFKEICSRSRKIERRKLLHNCRWIDDDLILF